MHGPPFHWLGLLGNVLLVPLIAVPGARVNAGDSMKTAVSDSWITAKTKIALFG